MIQFNRKYFIWAVLLFITEVLIALFIDDRIVRPYVGDLLVVILMYSAVKSILNTPVWPTALSVLVFSFVIETLQYFHFVRLVGLQHSRLANIVMGNMFQWIDLVAYTMGIAIVIFIETRQKKLN